MLDWSQVPIEDGIQTAHFATAVEFVDALRPSGDAWWVDGHNPWMYRGHGDARWPLVPTAWRDRQQAIANAALEAEARLGRWKISQIINWGSPGWRSNEVPFGKAEEQLLRALSIATNAELLLLMDFAAGCEAIGLQTPLRSLPSDPVINPDWLQGPLEPLITDNFPFYYPELGELAAMAQHHGLPTRLLDWTFNPLAAVFFAATKPSEPIGSHLSVAALNRRAISALRGTPMRFPGLPHESVAPKMEVFRFPSRDNDFMLAQSGAFTVMFGAGIYYMTTGGKRPSLEDFVTEAYTVGGEVVLRKLLLPTTELESLREILRRERVSRAGFMPTREHVAEDVLERWQIDARTLV